MANRKTSAEVRSFSLKVRLTWPEANAIAQKAACAGISLANYARQALGLEIAHYKARGLQEDMDKAQLAKLGRKHGRR